MVSLFRRYQQPLMIAVTVLIIVTFTIFYSRTDFLDKGGNDRVATIYGRTVSYAVAQRTARKAEICQMLGLRELYEMLAVNREEARENFIWNSMVLKHEAERLGIEPSADDVVAAVKAMPAFKTNGTYDSARYNMAVQVVLTPRGFTPDDLEDLIRDDLRFRKIKALLGSTVVTSDAELRAAFAENSQKIEASVVRLKIDDCLAAAQVPDEELQKEFEQRKARLKSDERRKVRFVAFILPTTDKPLENKARVEALKELSKKADEFSIAMTEKDAKLEDVAAKAEAKIEETPEFTLNEPPAALGGSEKAAAAAFRLTKAEPNSDVVESDRGYFVLQLADVVPARPLTFEEAKPKLADELKRARAQESLSLKASELRTKIETEIKAGKSFAEAAEAAGAKAEKFPAFSRGEPQFDQPDAMAVMDAAGELKEGELSPTVPTPAGGVIVHVEKRLPLDEAKFAEQKPRLVDGVGDFKRAALFQQWLKLRRAEAHVEMGGRS